MITTEAAQTNKEASSSGRPTPIMPVVGGVGTGAPDAVQVHGPGGQ